jgi:PEP-CTERM motif
MGKVRFSWGRFSAALDRGRLAAITLLLVEAVVVYSLVSPANVQPALFLIPQTSGFGLETPTIPFETSDSDSTTKQNFYPYSVIPGGAGNGSELRNAIANDSIVRAHYADFVVANTRVERLKAPQAFYVSYRVGNNIFWTKKALTIQAGETILSDGAHLARTRCGNRLSAVPAAPVAKVEVAPEAMEAPAGGTLLATIAAPAEIPVTPVPLTEVAAPPPIGSAPPAEMFPLLPPYLPVGFGGSSKPGGPVTTPPGPPTTPPSGPSGTPPTTPPGGTPPVPAPEPSALLMLAAGFAGIFLRSRLRQIFSRNS